MTDIFDKCRNFNIVKQLIESGIYPYFKALESEQAPEITIKGKKFIMFGSNNYLGLANDPRMKAASIEAVKKFGTGVAGSRFLNGNTVLHMELERKLAAFKGREAALIYATGYQMNLGVIAALVGKGDFAIVDKLDHASILDGCRLSHGELRRFKHNDPESLDKVLKEIGPRHGKLVIVDGVFSMEGDIAPIPELSKVCRKHGARFMVDDAHATGVLGRRGHGTCEHFGLTRKEVDLVVGTCSKSFASVGGFVVGDTDILHYIQHISRSMIFSAALPPASVAAISKAIDIIEEEPERIKKLWDNSNYLMKRFKAMGLNTGETQTPIIPVLIGDNEKTFMLWRMLYDHGLFTNPVVSPAVPPKRSMLRVVATATHTREQLDRALDIFETCVKKVLKRKSAALVK
ncbi:MAG: 8-amino-7-oxononanoate synthase [Elusimicrobia bacterium GWA2_61_42]|nr:MAG: 8-amino-7-oxononanoate synthase [Elusimicrobia bacterium GWA2_61_42]OGR77259.1 MAG: 8-amino-7-oxononanoate synthase [Elusimicrobia bacterium GWC2_61_25]